MMLESHRHRLALRRLQRELAAAFMVGLAVLALGFWWSRSVLWLGGASFYLLFAASWCMSHIEEHQRESVLHDRLGSGFWVTWFRVLGLAYLTGAVCEVGMLTESGVLAAVVYGLVVCGDALDGYCARLSGTVSQMGSRLDNLVDGSGMFVVSVAAVLIGSLPIYYLLLSLAYFGFHIGLWWRVHRGLPLFRDRMMLSLRNRYFAGAHMAVLVVALWPGAQGLHLTVVASLGEILLLLCFLRDWLYVTGVVVPGKGRFVFVWGKALSFSLVQGALMARVSVGLALVFGGKEAMPLWLVVALVAVAAGVLARSFAWLALVALVLGVAAPDYSAAALLVPSLAWVAWFGSGPWSSTRLDDGVYLRAMPLRAE